MASRQLFRRVVPLLSSGIQCCLRYPLKVVQTGVTQPTLPRISQTSILLARSLCAKAKFKCINIHGEKDFQEHVIDNKTPVVVDFHATWCGPCKLLGPRLESVVAGKEGKVVLAKIDIDDNTDLAMRFGVQSVPTVMGIKGGQPQGKFIGLQDTDIIDSFVERLIN